MPAIVASAFHVVRLPIGPPSAPSNDHIASDAAQARVSVAIGLMAHLGAARYRAGSNNSMGLPSGSSI
jgi:hypothetical protein